ncbi:MAG TPA: alpha/beta hydrolase, partial [Dehalococcoidia bacterium]|nr:alpha/beta hydrolase [Dehalococcoidia bacterium]
MEQDIRFCTASDGVTIAYSSLGAGTPILLVPGWVSHLELDLQFPHSQDFLEGLLAGDRRRVVRYDGRGTGLSDREVDDVSVAARVRDIEAVVDHLGLTSFVLFGWSMGGPPAVIFASQHPEKVFHLVLYASFARPYARGREEVCRALLALMRAEWAVGSKTVVEFTSPGVDREMADSTAQYFRQAASVRVATAILEEGMFQTDVSASL